MSGALRRLRTDREWQFALALVLLGLLGPALLPEFRNQIAILWILVVLAVTWDLQGGQMGYNSFGNILFFGLGMYLGAGVQIGLHFEVAEWTEFSGENTFVHTPRQYFSGMAAGYLAAAALPALAALALGRLILAMRGHYFAICTLGLGIAAGEIAASVETIGAGSGMTVPVWPEGVGDVGARNLFFCYLSFAIAVAAFATVRWLLSTRFGLGLNAIRDDEDKAESMGLPTRQLKAAGWCVSALFLGLAGATMGHIVGFIDPTEVAFAGATYGVFMVLMAVLGGKGNIWGPVLGALVFHFFQEFFWTYFLGWQRVMLGLLIVVVVVFFPGGILGLLGRGRRAQPPPAAAEGA